MKNLILSFLVLGGLIFSCTTDLVRPQFDGIKCDKQANGVIVVEVDDLGATVYYIQLVTDKSGAGERIEVPSIPADLREVGLRVSFSYRVLQSANSDNYSGSCGNDQNHSSDDTLDNYGTPDVPLTSVSLCDYEILP